jgi:hypothetical protein
MYLFAIFEKRFTLKEGYHYMKNHWLDWFPAMPSYQAYNYRLNQLYWQLEVIIGELMAQMPYQDCYPDISLADSLPIILSKRPYQARVALQVADKGSNPMSSHRQVRCSTKDLYYQRLVLSWCQVSLLRL